MCRGGSTCGVLLCALLLGALAACSDEGPPAAPEAVAGYPVVYGVDDRIDVYAHPDPAWRALARHSVVALVRADILVTTDPDDIRFRGRTLGRARSLCAGERFADQPSIAYCSGTLIAPDLVLTAGHCLEDAADCRDTRFVFNFVMESEEARATITLDDVFSCGALLSTFDDGRADYALVRLDRPAEAPRTPAPVRFPDEALPVGTGVGVIGFPSGIPAKIDLGGTVTRNRPTQRDYFQASLDTFGGNSGSGVFTLDGTVAGLLVRGERDYVRDGSCFRVNVLPEPGPGQAGESVTYVARAIEALCALEPEHTLCSPPDRVYCAPCADDAACATASGGSTNSRCDAPSGGVGVCLPACQRPADCRPDHVCTEGVCTPERTRFCQGDEVEELDACGRRGGPVDVCDSGTRCSDGRCVPREVDASCAGASTVPAESGSLTGVLPRGGVSGHRGSCAGEGPEKVYRFTVDEPVRFEATARGFDTVLYLRTVCDDPGAEVLCNDDSSPPGGLGSRIAGELEPGTYWLFLDAWDGDTGEYRLDLAFEPLCSTCTPGEVVCDGHQGLLRCGGTPSCPRAAVEPCGPGRVCEAGRCAAAACIDPCSPGEAICRAAGTPAVCVATDDGCGAWEERSPCGEEERCLDGSCVGPGLPGPPGTPAEPPPPGGGVGTGGPAPTPGGVAGAPADEGLDVVEDVEQNGPALPGCQAAGRRGGPWPIGWMALLFLTWGPLRRAATRTPQVPCFATS